MKMLKASRFHLNRLTRRVNKMMKKLLACILALMMALTMVGALAEDDLSEHVTVTLWLFPDDYTYYSNYSDNPVVQYLNEKFNMTMDFQIPPMAASRISST